MGPDYATCPECSARVELTPKKKYLKTHRHNDVKCPGSGKPAPGARTIAGLFRTAAIFSGIVAALASIAGILTWLGVSPTSSGPSSLKTASPPPIHIASSSRQLVSSGDKGIPGNGDSGRPSFDSSGRYVAFTSDATNISQNATGLYNIYRKDLVSGSVYLASAGLDGMSANGSSEFPTICSTGRFIAFASLATNLIPERSGIDGKYYQVYVNDSLTGQTTLVSANASGTPANSDSRAPMFNHNCTKVVFESGASNLVPGRWNAAYNVYVKNLSGGSVTLASANSDGMFLDNGSTHAAISDSGALVAFTSWASDLPGAVAGHPAVYLRDLRSGRTVNVSSAYGTYCNGAAGYSWPNFSPDGKYLIFTSVTSVDDVNFRGKCVFVWDINKGASAITGASGQPVGWNDACVDGINNGTTFAPVMGDPSGTHPYLVLFTVADVNSTCRIVLRDLDGNDIPIKAQVNLSQNLEPNMNSSGQYLSWDVAGKSQQVYACEIDKCTDKV